MKRELEKIIIKVESDVLTYAEKELLKQALTELDELKRDVARYFELQYKNQFSSMSQNEIHEMYVLRDKLSKVKP